MTHFADRLATAVQDRGTPVLVGLDPRLENLPAPLACEPTAAWDQKADRFRRFCFEIIDVVAPLVPAVKPQAAFFEQLGPPGMQALADVIRRARQRDLIVVLDGKRNDIGSTAAAYADAYLGDSGQERSPHTGAGPHAGDSQGAWGSDALTVSPYLGDDSLEPFIQVARERGAGLFVLVKTSNPGSRLFQDLQVGEQLLFERVGRYVEQRAAESAGRCGYGFVGGVVGATHPRQLEQLRAAMPHTWFLVPGFGAQGGTAGDVAAAFDSRGLGAIVNSSRAIIFAHERPPYRERYAAADWQRAVEDATRDMIAQLRADTPAGALPGR